MTEEPTISQVGDKWSAKSKDGWSVRGKTQDEAVQKFRRVAQGRSVGKGQTICVKKL
jgi:hypothetical protein